MKVVRKTVFKKTSEWLLLIFEVSYFCVWIHGICLVNDFMQFGLFCNSFINSALLLLNSSKRRSVNLCTKFFLNTLLCYHIYLPYTYFLVQRWSIRQFLKVQSCKLCNNKYLIVSIQITNTQIFALRAVLVFMLLSRKIVLLKEL